MRHTGPQMKAKSEGAVNTLMTKKLQHFLVLGPWQVSLTHMRSCTTVSTTAFGDEEGKVVKIQRRDQRHPSCMDVSSGVCVLLLPK